MKPFVKICVQICENLCETFCENLCETFCENLRETFCENLCETLPCHGQFLFLHQQTAAVLEPCKERAFVDVNRLAFAENKGGKN